jgi:hypothetical protein
MAAKGHQEILVAKPGKPLDLQKLEGTRCAPIVW